VHRIELTVAQALVRHLVAQRSVPVQGGPDEPLFAAVFAIFGHGNVAGLGEALQHVRGTLPTLRAHNEQAMAHIAIAYAKAKSRRQLMACTTSVGPGATNLVTAAALAHVNRLPVLLLPGDTFASRRPDPVLQQVEAFGDPTVTANDTLRPVSRYWDRITRPEQLLRSLPAAISVLLDPAECGPATLALPQDVQAERWAWPEEFFAPQVHAPLRPGADPHQLAAAAALLSGAKRPLLIAGGGVHYSGACAQLAEFATRFGLPVAETQAGKGALAWDHPSNVGGLGVTGSRAANTLAGESDLLVAIGTRLQDFTTGSGRLLGREGCRLLTINVARHDAVKFGALPVIGDAARTLGELTSALAATTPRADWVRRTRQLQDEWQATVEAATRPRGAPLPSDAEVLGVANRVLGPRSTVVCAAGGLPGELHKLWRASGPGSYHVEYGYSCMGYEIAGGLGVKMAEPERDVAVLVGDGSYLMLNSEIATSIALQRKLLILVLDNRGFGCINRLQQATAGGTFNNLRPGEPHIDFAAHARSLGAVAEKVANLADLEAALRRALAATRTAVVVIDTDPEHSTPDGGAWWDVPVAEVSVSPQVQGAREKYRRQQDS